MTLRTIDDDLNDPGLARLLTLARERFEALGGPRGRIVVPALEANEALAIDGVWKRASRRIRPRRGQDFPCALRDLDASLLETFGLTLEEALVRLGGGLELRPVARSRQAALATAFWERALEHPFCRHQAAAREWVQRLRQSGVLGTRPFESERGATLIPSLDVALTLPREPGIELSTLASEMLGDPHALADGSPRGDRLVALLCALERGPGGRMAAGERRALLGRFGVLCDPASATVLTLGLRPVGDSPLEEALRVLAGSHVVITLGQLGRSRPRFEHGLLIRLCENPAVVLRAEDRLGAAAGPLVCTGGWPGSAVCALLDRLRDHGARFEHHGDFDWEGVAIARWLRDRYQAAPWQFDDLAYRRAVATLGGRQPTLRPPRHRHPADDPLVCALEQSGIAVPEEAILNELVADLALE